MNINTLSFVVFLSCCCNNGYAQNSTHRADTGAVSAKFRRAIVFIAPVQFTENGPGTGLTYEKVLNARNDLHLCVSGIVTFNVANTNKIYNYNTGYYNTGNANPMFYLMPGIQFNPFGAHRKVTYAIGPSIVMGSGKKSSDYYTLHGLNLAENIQRHFIAGILLQNSLEVNYTPRICLEIELGFGKSFINMVGGGTESNELLLQGSVKLGFRL